MKNQALFSSKDKSQKIKCRLLQFLFSALRVIFVSLYTYLKNCCNTQLVESRYENLACPQSSDDKANC